MDKYLSKCRTCLKRNGTVSLLTIEDCKTLRDIMSCLTIEISEEDDMPQYICRICTRTILKFQTFKRICEKTDQLLREMIERTTQNGKRKNPPTSNAVIENISDGQFDINEKRVHSGVTRVRTCKKKKKSSKPLEPKENQKNKTNNFSGHLKNTSGDEKCSTNQKYILEDENCMEYCTSLESQNKAIVDNETIQNDTGNSIIQSEHTTICGVNIKEGNNRITLQELYFSQEPVLSAAVKVPKKKRRLRKYLCASCGYAANDKCSLRVHTRLHTGEKPFACTQCERRFAVKANLNSHIQLHSGSRRFVCEVCGRSFAAAASLRGHAHIHTGARPHVCKTCSRAFFSASNLRAHTRTHSDERPHSCDVCSRAFKSTSELHQHKRRHTGARPHACPQCARSFALASNLSAHVRTHATAEHNCMHCDRTFTCKAALSAHQRVHTDERRFACEHCGKRFSRKTTLDTHHKTHKNSTIKMIEQSSTGSNLEQNTPEDTLHIKETVVQPTNYKDANEEINLNHNREKNSPIYDTKLIGTQKNCENIDKVIEMTNASNSSRRNTNETKVNKKTAKNKNVNKISMTESKNKRMKNDYCRNNTSKSKCMKNTDQSNVTSNVIATPSIGNFPITSFIRMVPIQTGDVSQQNILGTPIKMVNVQKLSILGAENNRMDNLEVSDERGVRTLQIQTPEGLRIVSNQIPLGYIPVLINETPLTENIRCFLPVTNNVMENNGTDTNLIADSN